MSDIKIPPYLLPAHNAIKSLKGLMTTNEDEMRAIEYAIRCIVKLSRALQMCHDGRDDMEIVIVELAEMV